MMEVESERSGLSKWPHKMFRIDQFESLPAGLRCSAGVEGNEKSIGDGGGAGVSPYSWVARDERVLDA